MSSRHPFPHLRVRARRPVPARWLMTDERAHGPGPDLSPALLAALDRLAPGDGIIARHYWLTDPARVRFVRGLRRIARARRLVLILALPPVRAMALGADGAHDRSPRRSRGLRTMAVHDLRDAMAARRLRVDAGLVSPVRDTRSHPVQRALGFRRAASLSTGLRDRAVALGGMNGRHWRAIRRFFPGGWAGIDAWSEPT